MQRLSAKLQHRRRTFGHTTTLNGMHDRAYSIQSARPNMDRRGFLKSATATAAVSVTSLAAPAVFSPAKAQARAETLLIVSESGPNNLDIHGVGTNVPGYEASWNCYDRLISHEMKTGPNGVLYYDRDKFKMELAEDMNVGPMSATFKLKKNATF